jgi:O-methyltransferase involved in polyketide biosynthesis
VPYLTEQAVFATLGFIAGLAKGSEVVFTYSDPPQSMPARAEGAHGRRAARVAALGEPWLTFFAPQTLHPRLRALGFGEIEDLGPTEVSILYFGAPAGSPDRKGGHLVRARLG